MQDDWGWGIVVSVMRRGKGNKDQPAANGTVAQPTAEDLNPAAFYIVDTLLPCAQGSCKDGRPRPAPVGIGNSNSSSKDPSNKDASSKGSSSSGSNADMMVMPVALTLVTQLSSLRVGLPDDLRPVDARQSLLLTLQVC